MLEEWRGILDYPNYEVSTFGRVFNIKHNRFIKPFLKFGYEHVSLYHNGYSLDFKVHRLVATAFIPNPFNEREVNHIDGHKDNNFLENLEWTSRSNNLIHAHATGLKVASNRLPVRILETGEVFESITSCAEAINGSVSAISRCLEKPNRTHKGLTFELVERR